MRIFRLFAAPVLLAASLLASPAIAEPIAYVVADATSGHVLDSRAPRDKRQVASLTKIASAIVILDWCDLRKVNLGDLVTVPVQAITPGVTNPVNFQPGDRVSIRDLLFCSLLQSDNIAVDALALHFGAQIPGDGSLTPTQRFVQQMNALARNLRMDRTLFLNAHGIDATDNPYSTAQDMARLTKHALTKSGFRFFVTQKERRIGVQRAPAMEPPLPAGGNLPPGAGGPAPALEPPRARPTAPAASDYLLRNTNELLGQMEIDGVKTGQTNKAGSCLIISATKPPVSGQVGNEVRVTPRKLIVVILGSPDRFNDARGLLQRGWQLYDQWSAQGRQMGDVKKEL